MSKPRTYQTEAIIIKKTKLGEADRILTLYTPHLGKIRVVAKGVRRPRSKMAGHLVTGSQTINSFLPLKSDLQLTSYALYAVELVDQFTADNDENYPLFQLLVETMHRLCQGNNNELILRYFELHLLNQVGYRPQLGQCVSCHSPLKANDNSFSPSAGGVLCPRCSQSQFYSYPLSANALKVLRFLQDNNYNTCSRLKIDPELSQEIEGVMRNYLKYLLEREVKSATWLDSLRGQIRQMALL